MDAFKTNKGETVTEEMVQRWSAALDQDKWPEGEHNAGPATVGRPPMSPEGSSVISVKVPKAMKKAVEHNAKLEGISTSDYVRQALTEWLMQA